MKQLKCGAGGDSWAVHLPFDLGTGGGLADALFGKVMDVPYWNIAHAGDSSEESMGLAMSTKLEQHLPGTDILLWSSGGDDFAGDMLDLFLFDNKGQGVDGAVDLVALRTALKWTMRDYARLIEIRDTVAPNCTIVFHTYDYPPASQMGVGFITYGPWLKPSLDHRGWTNADDQEAIVKQFLLELGAELEAFCANMPNVVFVDTQGTCGEHDWANELHLNSNGCIKVAQKLNLHLLPILDEKMSNE